MLRSWHIGDAIEVEFISLDGDGSSRTIWIPATVCGIAPLSVAFSDGERLTLHDGIGRRAPRRTGQGGGDE